jgi:predicted NBD/HSP70 family sugar kinase
MIGTPRTSRTNGTDDHARHTGHLRRLNLERVLAVATERPGPFTRSELVHATGLSVPTVGNLAAQLVRRGVLRDLGTGPSRGGRRPGFMEFNARYGFAAGIDLGPARTRFAVANLRGEPILSRVVATPTSLWPAALLGRLAAMLRAALKEADVPSDRLLAVAAGAPGVVDQSREGTVTLAPNLKGWSQVPMGEMLRRALETSVTVENDVNLAILGERWRGAARGHDTCAFLSVDAGIGAGIVINGELHRGHHFLAGEIGMMCMGPQHVEADFGTRGCLETLAGLGSVAERGPRLRGGSPERRVAALFEAAQGGDARARKVVREVAALVGMAAANLSLVIDPSLLVLGGGLIAQGEPLVSEIRRVVDRIVPAPMQIVMSALGEEAPLWGSVLVAVNEAQRRMRQELREARAK